MRQYVVDAFTDKVFGGNPAAVCVLAFLFHRLVLDADFDRMEILEVVYDGTTYNWGKFIENGVEGWICMDYVALGSCHDAGEMQNEKGVAYAYAGAPEGNDFSDWYYIKHRSYFSGAFIYSRRNCNG